MLNNCKDLCIWSMKHNVLITVGDKLGWEIEGIEEGSLTGEEKREVFHF